MPRWKRTLFWLGLAVLVVFVCEIAAFALLSLASDRVSSFDRLRELQRDRTQDSVAHGGVPYPIHPYLGFVTAPSATLGRSRFSRQAAEYGFPYNIHDLFLEPSDARFVVLVTGGSVAGGLGPPFKPLKTRLERLDRFRGKEIVILSLATGGYKQPQQLMALTYLLALGAHFDLVINVDGFNEVALPAAENVPQGFSPYYPRGWQLQVGPLDMEQRKLVGRIAYQRDRRAAWARRFLEPPWRYSWLAAAVWTGFDRRWGQEIHATEVALATRPRGPDSNYEARGPHYQAPSAQALFENLVDLWQRSSRQMHELTNARGIEYYHFLQPNQYDPGSKPLSNEERHNAVVADHPYRAGVVEAYPLLREAGRELVEEGAAFEDLSWLFIDVTDTLYIDDCCHFNKQGNRLMLKAIAEKIGATSAEATSSSITESVPWA